MAEKLLSLYKTEKVTEDTENKVIIKEEYKVENVSFSQFEIKVIRMFYTTPSKLFDGKIVVEIRYELADETKDNFENEEELKKYIESKPYVFVNKTPVGSSISLLAGQITSTFNGMPLWMNPVINGDEN